MRHMLSDDPAADDHDDDADDDDKDNEDDDGGGGDGEGGCAADGCYAVDIHCGVAHADDDYDDDSESSLHPRMCTLLALLPLLLKGDRLQQVALDINRAQRTRSFKSPIPPSLRTSPSSSHL